MFESRQCKLFIVVAWVVFETKWLFAFSGITQGPRNNVIPQVRFSSTTRTIYIILPILSLIARFMGPTWGPFGADRTQLGPMLAPRTLLSGVPCKWQNLWSFINTFLVTLDKLNYTGCRYVSLFGYRVRSIQWPCVVADCQPKTSLGYIKAVTISHVDTTSYCLLSLCHGPLARYVKLRFTHAPGMPGTFSPAPRVSDPDMHHGKCVSVSFEVGSGKNVPGIPGACATHNITYLVRGPCNTGVPMLFKSLITD